MDIFLQESSEPRLPPEEVRLRKLKITPILNGNKVKLNLELSPFMKRPNIEVTIFDPSGKEVAHSCILEAVLPKMEVVMHLRASTPGSQYRIEISVYYQRLPEPSETQEEVAIPEPMIVDHHEASFTTPPPDR